MSYRQGQRCLQSKQGMLVKIPRAPSQKATVSSKEADRQAVRPGIDAVSLPSQQRKAGTLNTKEYTAPPAGFTLPPEIYTPCDTPGYEPAYVGHEAQDINLVVEGGALRGIFAAGVQDFFMDVGLWAKNTIGVSAGALCGANYVSGSRGRTCYINVRFCNDWHYLSMQSFLVTGNAYGVEFAFHDIPAKYCAQDNEGFANSPSNLIAVVTNLETGKAEYLHVKDLATDWPYVRASSAMPFVSETVMIDGKPYLDGGLADSIPLDYSLELGAKKHIVLLTQDRDYRKESNPSSDLAKVFYREYPEFAKTIERRAEVYNQTREKVFAMHDAGEIFAIYPQEKPYVTHMETNRVKVFDFYMDGYKEAARQWPALKEYLAS